METKCSKCDKPAEVYLRKRTGLSAVCMEHYIQIKRKRLEKQNEQ